LGAGVGSYVGLLDKPGILDDNDIIIDNIIPDYSIIETIDYLYPLNTGYLTYMSKGCTRKCEFCAVPKLEPDYKNKLSIKEHIKHIAQEHGERKDLILMDNNVLGSPRFAEIIQEILDMGFTRDAYFIEPNKFITLVNYLLKSNHCHNKNIFLKKIFDFLMEFGNSRIKSTPVREQYYQLLREQQLDSLATFKLEVLLDVKDKINEYVEKYRNKSKKNRYVDFNQGLDCRYLNEENIKLLSQIPLRPMRISFDFIAFEHHYRNAIHLAEQYGIYELSNYMLYNYKDKPEELWQRLKITNDLNKQLKVNIYSFPMKYLPAWGPNATNRSYVGPYWCPKYLRAIQIILNVTKGIVAVTPAFFEKAFGKSQEEFFKILMMPEPYIRYRYHFEQTGDTDFWFYQWNNLNTKELAEAESLIRNQNFFNLNGLTSKAVVEFIKHYQVEYRPDRKTEA